MRWSTFTALASIGLFGVIGCSDGKSDYKKTADLKKAPAIHEDHDHGEKGPHGGSIVELGKEEFHAEVVLDHDKHELKVYVLGGDAKTPQATAATELTITPHGKDALKLKAAPQAGDGDGKSSQFVLIDEAVVHALLDAGAIHGELQVTIGTTPFKGEVDYHLDDMHHEHKDVKPAEGASKDDAAKTDDAKSAEPPKDAEGK